MDSITSLSQTSMDLVVRLEQEVQWGTALDSELTTLIAEYKRQAAYLQQQKSARISHLDGREGAMLDVEAALCRCDARLWLLGAGVVAAHSEGPAGFDPIARAVELDAALVALICGLPAEHGHAMSADVLWKDNHQLASIVLYAGLRLTAEHDAAAKFARFFRDVVTEQVGCLVDAMVFAHESNPHDEEACLSIAAAARHDAGGAGAGDEDDAALVVTRLRWGLLDRFRDRAGGTAAEQIAVETVALRVYYLLGPPAPRDVGDCKVVAAMLQSIGQEAEAHRFVRNSPIEVAIKEHGEEASCY